MKVAPERPLRLLCGPQAELRSPAAGCCDECPPLLPSTCSVSDRTAFVLNDRWVDVERRKVR